MQCSVVWCSVYLRIARHSVHVIFSRRIAVTAVAVVTARTIYLHPTGRGLTSSTPFRTSGALGRFPRILKYEFSGCGYGVGGPNIVIVFIPEDSSAIPVISDIYVTVSMGVVFCSRTRLDKNICVKPPIFFSIFSWEIGRSKRSM